METIYKISVGNVTVELQKSLNEDVYYAYSIWLNNDDCVLQSCFCKGDINKVKGEYFKYVVTALNDYLDDGVGEDSPIN